VFTGFNGRIAARASGVMLDSLALLDLVLPLVGCRYVCNLLASPNLEESWQAVQCIEDLPPGHLVESISVKELEFHESFSRYLSVHPKAQFSARIRGKFVTSHPDCNGFKRKGLLRKGVETHPPPYYRLCRMVSPAIQLCGSAQFSVAITVVLVATHMEVFQGEGKLLAIDHYILEYVSVFTLGWDPCVREMEYSTQGAQAVREDLDMPGQILDSSTNRE